MQFALPPRNMFTSASHTRSSRTSLHRRKRLKLGALLALAVLGIYYLSSRTRSTSIAVINKIPLGTPETVIVTILEPDMSTEYREKIMNNREDYVKRHGYAHFVAQSGDYDTGIGPKSWVLIPALRHAMTNYTYSTYFFSLSAHSLIMNPKLSLTSHIMEPKRLESLMLKDKPVVPPDSVIHTFSHLTGDKIDFVLTQDGEGLCQESFILRRGDWSTFFLDVWFDPLYRAYNFQKAEGHALEHIVQWHPTILTKLALIPVRTMNSYTANIATRGGDEVTYRDGDFVVRAVGCEKDSSRNCEEEMKPWYDNWSLKYGPRSIAS